MYLKQIEIIGFKSFAKKTQIELNGNITAVVGPNGSGKSNVADAVKWVLGEQRVKSLRGDKMEDVIFNGTLEKRPLGYAQVSLLIDNSSKILPIDYDEVNITRRLFRSGESQYYINKTPCRLKDIQQLFMDTGLGREGYSIIGQGQVQEIIDGNVQSRRLLIEEAVGIVKYKAKKAEAERKLEKTQMNLDRAEDIISELYKRIEPLKKQSDKAKKYLALRDELKERELNIYSHKLEEYQKELEKHNDDKLIIENNYKDIDNNFINIEKKTKEILNIISDYESELNDINSKIYELSNKKENTKTQWEISKIKYEQNKKGIKELNEEIVQIQSSLNALYEQEKDLANNLQALENDYLHLTEIITTQKKAVQEMYEMQNNFINRESEYKNLLYMEERYEKDLEENLKKFSDIKINANNLNNETEALKNEISKYQNDCIKLKEQNDIFLKNKENYENIINETLQKIKVLQSQLSMLKANEDDMQGYGYAVKKILQYGKNNTASGICGVVAELINVEDKYLKAVTAAIGGAFKYIVVDNEKTASECIDLLNKNKWGRVTFMPVSVIKPAIFSAEEKRIFADCYEDVACDLVKYGSAYDAIIKHILGRVLIAKNTAQAVKLAGITKHKYKIVTLNGEVFMPGGIIIGGESKTDNIAPLQRKKRIDEIKKEIQTLQNNYDGAVKELAKSRQCIEKNSLNIDNLQNQLNELNLKIINKTVEYKNLKVNESNIIKDNEQIQEQLRVMREKKEAFTKMLDKNTDIEEIRKSYNAESEKLNKLNIEITKISENIKYKKDKLLGIKNEIEKNIKQNNQNKEKIAYLENETKKIKDYIEQYHNNSELFENQKNGLKERYDNILAQKNSLNDEFNKSNVELISISKEKNDLKDAINSLIIKINSITLKIEQIRSHLLEDYQTESDDLTGYKKDIDNFEKYASETAAIKKTIKSFGSINVGAIEEYRQVTERYEFLTSQRDDLMNAKKDIECVIKDVEKNMAAQFKEQFSLIQNEFDKTFKKLFGGGSASLKILDENDLLNTGIDISAQPPGKKLKNISMLSGGEKAMTSIALLFAILKIKPAPFCVLDEIDAALDDHNVSLFAKYISEERRNNQLIIITHKKRTMEVCDCLYGASMGNEGVTKIVSLKLTS